MAQPLRDNGRKRVEGSSGTRSEAFTVITEKCGTYLVPATVSTRFCAVPVAELGRSRGKWQRNNEQAQWEGRQTACEYRLDLAARSSGTLLNGQHSPRQQQTKKLFLISRVNTPEAH